jgi:hypothetical protein
MSENLESLLDAQRRADCEANDEKPADPSQMQLCMNPHWKYTPANETDIRATWRKFGWLPVMAFRSLR